MLVNRRTFHGFAGNIMQAVVAQRLNGDVYESLADFTFHNITSPTNLCLRRKGVQGNSAR